MPEITDETISADILSHYGIAPVSITPLEIGLINRTWLVTDKHHRYILQQVNPMFGPEIHADIDAVTRHLSGQGLITPRLLHTIDGNLYSVGGGQIWRMFDYIDGYTVNSVDKPAFAFEAGVLLARFHNSLHTLPYEFRHRRAGVHETERHLQILRSALENRQDHLRYPDIRPLAIEILDTAARLPVLPDTPLRKVHGDPKINNFLFEKRTGKGICMLDFDTLGTMALPLELGDAMRSWCNPIGENSVETYFAMENYSAGLQGYLSSAPEFVLEQEWASILPATQVIYVELAARFCADALNENHFSWDSSRYASHSEHSQLRAQGQFNAYKSLKAQIRDAEKLEAQHLADCICCH